MERPKTLIADDRREWQRIISEVLASEYDVVGFVADGKDVISSAITLSADVITLDVSMPGISGLRLLPDLRSALPHAAIIIVTAYWSRLYIDEAYQRGADGYVAKNAVISELLPTISKAMNSIQQCQRSWP
jgi:DNA-binding NarL/FixJ family response regulator